jgi:hypothetical protein
MSMDKTDFYVAGHSSSCCGAEVLLGDMCADCGEHCEAVADGNDGAEKAADEWAQQKQLKDKKEEL